MLTYQVRRAAAVARELPLLHQQRHARARGAHIRRACCRDGAGCCCGCCAGAHPAADAAGRAGQGAGAREAAGAPFACFTNTTVQILTQKKQGSILALGYVLSHAVDVATNAHTIPAAEVQRALLLLTLALSERRSEVLILPALLVLDHYKSTNTDS
jgi:hypothetical protein